MADRGDDESKIAAPNSSSTGGDLLDRIEKLDLSSSIRKKIAAIASNSTGTRVDLFGDNIGDVGAAAIGEGLRYNTTLIDLALMHNNISDVGASSIGDGLSKNTTLQTLSLSMNKISNVGASSIVDGLSKNTTLQKLYLSGNKITQTGYLTLAKGFRWTETLRQLGAHPEGVKFVYMEKNKREIGRGEFGSVYLGKSEEKNGSVGAQVVEKTSHGGSHREEIYERLILQGLPEHKNIVRVAAHSHYDTLLLEAHKGGSLKDYAKMQEDGTPLPKFLSYSHGMCLAIEHLHRYGVIHRDIALRNYVLTEDLETPVLVDFGLSWPIQEEKYVMIRSTEMMPFRQCAPEVLSALQYSKGADIWQFGLTVWQLLHRGKQPFFQCANGQQLVQYLHKMMVQQKAHIPLPFKKNGASPALISTVKQLVVFCCPYDPDARPTATQVVNKIDSLRAAVGSEATAYGGVEEQKVVSKYEPSENDIDSGLMAYNYTDYQSLKTGGRRDYIDLKKDREEHGNERLEVFPEVDVEEESAEEESAEEEHEYQELETLTEK